MRKRPSSVSAVQSHQAAKRRKYRRQSLPTKTDAGLPFAVRPRWSVRQDLAPPARGRPRPPHHGALAPLPRRSQPLHLRRLPRDASARAVELAAALQKTWSAQDEWEPKRARQEPWIWRRETEGRSGGISEGRERWRKRRGASVARTRKREPYLKATGCSRQALSSYPREGEKDWVKPRLPVRYVPLCFAKEARLLHAKSSP